MPDLRHRGPAVSVGDRDAGAAFARACRAPADAGAQRGIHEAEAAFCLLLDRAQPFRADVNVEHQRAQRIKIAVHASASGDVQLARRAR